MQHSSSWAGNQSIHGFLLRALDRELLSPGTLSALKIAGVGALALLAALVWLRRNAVQRDPRRMVAAFGAFTIVVMIFSPISWEHYHLYLVPVWAWLVVETLSSPRLAVLVVPAVAASWAPVCIFDSGQWVMSEPWISHMLWASLVFLVLAVVRIAGAADPAPAS
jgi:hypothetical protein